MSREIAGHQIDVLGKIFPGAGDAFYFGLAAELSLRAYFTRHPRNFRRKCAQLIDHGVYNFCRAQKLSLERLSFDLGGHRFGQIPFCDSADHARHFTRGTNQILYQNVDAPDGIGPTVGHVVQRCPLCDSAFFPDHMHDPF